MKKTTVVLLVSGVLLLAAAYFVSQYNKPHREASSEASVATLTAKQLYSSYATDEDKSNSLYLDKVLEVSGIVEQINKEANGSTSLYLKTNDIGFVIGILSPNYQVEPIAIGSEIKLKGICTGYNMDIVLMRCELLK